MRSFNLMPADLIQKRALRRRAGYWVVIVGSYGLLIGAGAMAGLLQSAFSAQTQDVHASELEQRMQRAESELIDVQRAIADLKPELEIAQLAALRPDWSILLNALGDVCGENLVLERCSIGPADRAGQPGDDPLEPARRAGFAVQLSGLGRTQGDVTQFALELERLGLFSKVSILEMRRQDRLGRAYVAFEIAAVLDGRGEAR